MNFNLTRISETCSKIEKRWFIGFQERTEIVGLIRKEDEEFYKTINILKEKINGKQFENREEVLNEIKENSLKYFEFRSRLANKLISSNLIFKIHNVFLFLFKKKRFRFLQKESI